MAVDPKVITEQIRKANAASDAALSKMRSLISSQPGQSRPNVLDARAAGLRGLVMSLPKIPRPPGV